ncbi:MAG: hypothetical protein J1E38_02830 [Paramuribaculum sp.]|nr:hypothetical protein [Paramuribaculum sp.]
MKNEKIEQKNENVNASEAALGFEASVEPKDEIENGKEEKTEVHEEIRENADPDMTEDIPSSESEPEGGAKGHQLSEIKEIIELLREAEQKGFERGRMTEREEQSRRLMEELETTRSIWENDRLEELESERSSSQQVGSEFLSRIRPSVWD